MKRIGIGIVTGVNAELAALLPAAARTVMAGTPLSIERIAHSPFTLFLACDGIGKVAAATAAATLVTTARQMRRLCLSPCRCADRVREKQPYLRLPANKQHGRGSCRERMCTNV